MWAGTNWEKHDETQARDIAIGIEGRLFIIGKDELQLKRQVFQTDLVDECQYRMDLVERSKQLKEPLCEEENSEEVENLTALLQLENTEGEKLNEQLQQENNEVEKLNEQL